MKKERCLLLTLLMVLFFVEGYGQVTIGSGEEPHPGAVLELKSNDKRGLLMPWVALEYNTRFAPVDGDGDTANGMLVYNTNAGTVDASNTANGLNGKGVYVWIDGKWYALKDCTGGVDCDPVEDICPVKVNGQESGTLTVQKGDILTISVTNRSTSTDPVYYMWELPAGLTPIMMSYDASIEVVANLNGAISGDMIKVVAMNSCGETTSCDGDAGLIIEAGCPTFTLDIMAADNVTLCEGDEITLTVNVTSGEAVSYLWRYPADFSQINAPVETPTGTSITLKANVKGDYEGSSFYVIATDDCNVQRLATLSSNITVNSRPAAPAAIYFTPALPITLKTGETFTAYITDGSGANTYTWTVPTGLTITGGQGGTAITVRADVATVYNSADITVRTNSLTCGSSDVTRGTPGVIIVTSGCDLPITPDWYPHDGTVNPPTLPDYVNRASSTIVNLEIRNYDAIVAASASPVSVEWIFPTEASFAYEQYDPRLIILTFPPGVYNAEDFKIIVTNSCGSVESVLGVGTITIPDRAVDCKGPLGAIGAMTITPRSTTVGGTPITLEIEPVTNASQYIWGFSSNTTSQAFTMTQSGRTATLTPLKNGVFNASEIMVTVKNATACDTKSTRGTGTITVNTASCPVPVISALTIPASSICAGSPFTAAATATNSPTAYQWESLTTGFSIIPFGSGATITTTRGAGVYNVSVRVRAQNSCGWSEWKTVTKSINISSGLGTLPKISVSKTSLKIGETFTASIPAQAGASYYRWSSLNSNIFRIISTGAGASVTSVTIQVVGIGAATQTNSVSGSLIQVQVSSNCGSPKTTDASTTTFTLTNQNWSGGGSAMTCTNGWLGGTAYYQKLYSSNRETTTYYTNDGTLCVRYADSGEMTFPVAKAYCEGLTDGGGGWRLPSFMDFRQLKGNSAAYNLKSKPTEYWLNMIVLEYKPDAAYAIMFWKENGTDYTYYPPNSVVQSNKLQVRCVKHIK